MPMNSSNRWQTEMRLKGKTFLEMTYKQVWINVSRSEHVLISEVINH